MRWAESESCAKLYMSYILDLIKNGKVEITATNSDSLAHTLRYVLKGFSKRQQAPYHALYDNVIVKVVDNTVVMKMKDGRAVIDSISENEYRILAPASFQELLIAVGTLMNGQVERVAFADVIDFDSAKQSSLKELCDKNQLTYSFSEKSVVVMK